MSSTRPLVSVVTPVHNTEAYLGECIESVLAQSFGDFEYVIVDNQSSDRSAAIAEEYAAVDSRIRLVRTQDLLAQVPNYNFALGQISPHSKYCKIVQADDWLFPECLEKMTEVAESDPGIVMVGSYHLYGRLVLFSGVPVGQTIHDGGDICRAQLRSRHYLMGNPTTLLYRADVVRARSPFFATDRYHEDTEVAFDLLRDGRFGFVHQVLSFVRVEEDSITGAWKDFDWFLALRYAMVRRYGPIFFPLDKAARLESTLTREYWKRLASAAMTLEGKEYFAHHRARLSDGDERLLASLLFRWPLRIVSRYLHRIGRGALRRMGLS